MAKIVGLIPARYHSTRLPGKPLALINGRPMIEHVYKRAVQSAYLEEVWVATDDLRIKETVEGFGGQAVMTSASHATGTDRLAEAAAKLEAEIIVNIQGDEPLIDPVMIDTAVKPLLNHPELQMATLKQEITAEEDKNSPNVVKVVTDCHNLALYFSRSLMPYPRVKGAKVYKHIGLYVYRKDFLLQFSKMPQTPLEISESLEQLRALENGYAVYVAETDCSSVGVDTKEDLLKVEEILKGMNS